MDARTNSKTKLPSRHVTAGPERAPHRSCDNAMGLEDLEKLASRGSINAALHLPAIAHACGAVFDLFDVADVFKKTPYLPDLKPGGRYVAKDLFEWKYAQQGSPALACAVTHPGGMAEKQCYADI